jgi:hypothetical protein
MADNRGVREEESADSVHVLPSLPERRPVEEGYDPDRVDWRYIISLLQRVRDGALSGRTDTSNGGSEKHDSDPALDLAVYLAAEACREHCVAALEQYHTTHPSENQSATAAGERQVRVSNLTSMAGLLSLGSDAISIRNKLLAAVPYLIGAASSSSLLALIEIMIEWKDGEAVVTALEIYCRFYGNDPGFLSHTAGGCVADVLSAVYCGADEFINGSSQISNVDNIHTLKCNDPLYQASVLGDVGLFFEQHNPKKPSVFVEDVISLENTKNFSMSQSLSLEADYVTDQRSGNTWLTTHMVDYQHQLNEAGLEYEERYDGSENVDVTIKGDMDDGYIFDGCQQLIALLPPDFSGHAELAPETIAAAINHPLYAKQLDGYNASDNLVPSLEVAIRIFRQNNMQPVPLLGTVDRSGFKKAPCVRKISRGNLDGVTKPALTLLAKRAGCLILSGPCYPALRGFLKDYLEHVLHGAFVNMQHARRDEPTSMLLTKDVQAGLRRTCPERLIAGYGMYG